MITISPSLMNLPVENIGYVEDVEAAILTEKEGRGGGRGGERCREGRSEIRCSSWTPWRSRRGSGFSFVEEDFQRSQIACSACWDSSLTFPVFIWSSRSSAAVGQIRGSGSSKSRELNKPRTTFFSFLPLLLSLLQLKQKMASSRLLPRHLIALIDRASTPFVPSRTLSSWGRRTMSYRPPDQGKRAVVCLPSSLVLVRALAFSSFQELWNMLSVVRSQLLLA